VNVRIYVYPADDAGCGHFRLIWPARALAEWGHDVKLVMPNERYNIHAEVRPDGRLNNVFFPEDADVIVMQRVSHRLLAEAIPLIRAKGTAVVIDMDDDLSSIHPHNTAWLNFHPRGGAPGSVTSEHNWHNAQLACERASLVTVSSDALVRRYAAHGRYAILRNCIPASYLDVEHTDGAVFGWGGSLASHPDDLTQMGHAPRTLQREGHVFKIIGDPGGIRENLNLDDEPETSGIVDITEWPKALSSLGVGVAPLADTVFNAAKSWLKPLEYAALGVPVVMSPRTEYLRFQRELGVGIVAKKPIDWLRKIRTLLESSDARLQHSEAGRLAAAAWTYERRAGLWLNAWQRAAEIG
jgi:glycosyltransferase involved in cell wall biosynthesis